MLVTAPIARSGAIGSLLVALVLVLACTRPRDPAPPPVREPEARADPPPAPAPPPPPPIPEGHHQIVSRAGDAVEIYPPASRAAAPLTIMLHGACMGPVDGCDFWSAAGRERGWLACPAGNRPCGDGFDWAGPMEERIAAVDADLEAIDAAYRPLVDHARGDVLIGYSRGGFLARELVYARPGRFRGVVLLGAAANPDPARFRAAGVRRVVLACGDHDGARTSMQRSARALTAAGVPARFTSLGRIGHALPGNLAVILRDAFDWLAEE